MCQSLSEYQNLRKHMNFIDEIQHQEVDEVWNTIKSLASKAKAAIAPSPEQQGSKDLNNIVDANFRWLGSIMSQSGMSWDTLTFGNMRNFLSAESNKLELNKSPGGAVDKVFAKVQQENPTLVSDTKDSTLLGTNAASSQKVAKSILRHGIAAVRAQATGLQQQELDIPIGQTIKTKRNEFIRTSRGWIVKGKPAAPLPIQQQDKLDDLYRQMRARGMVDEAQQPVTEWGIPKWLTKKPAPQPSTTQAVTLKQPATGVPQTAQPTSPAQPHTATPTKPAEPFSMQVDVNGQNVKVTKVEPSAKAPSGWYYWHPQYKTWVYPPKGSKDAKIFDQYYAAKTMRESSQQELDTHSNDLMAARRAEQQGDKATQYEKLADYHEKFSKVKKLKPADRVHHTTQAGIYRNAAQAVRSAQETLNKSSK